MQDGAEETLMVLSGSWAQVLAVVLLIVPGLVYQGARSRLRGPTPDEIDVSSRVLRAITVSAVLALATLLVTPGALLVVRLNAGEAASMLDRPAVLATAGVVFIAPLLLALAAHAVTVWRAGHRGRLFFANFVTYQPLPTAWDYAATGRRPCFIRVLTKDGVWIGGYAGPRSFISAFPQPRDVYVEVAYALDEHGAFTGPVEGSAGMWIHCADVQLLQLVSIPETSPGGQDDRD